MTVELTLLPRVAFRDKEITGARLRDLLALLAGDLRTGASTGRLVDGLWGDEQPENPVKALQVVVSRARSQLGPDVIVSTPNGYRLALTEDQVDAAAVLRHAAASAQHARANDHQSALAEAEAGLALFEGAESTENPDDPVSALRTERAVTHRSLRRYRALALSRLGKHADAVEALGKLAHELPRDEEVLLELLRCEAATLGPAAALARYDAYRRSLRDELGTDPGAPLIAEYQRLLEGERPTVRHGVPHEPNPLLGRDTDLAAVTNLLRSSRVTSIVGPGGLGKTRLAHAVSREAEQRVVHFVGLAGVRAHADVGAEVASALGVGEAMHPAVLQAAQPDVVTRILSALGAGPVLLVLDNCEHVIDGAAELVRALVSMSRDLRVLTTSRAPLGLSSEAVYLLPELNLDTTIELFEQRARAARPDVELPRDVVAGLCRHLDGLPLATELAAARTRVMSVPEIARRLADRFALLRGGARDAPQRHRALRSVVDWSWNLLDADGQAAMRALSVFPGGFTEDAAGHLIEDGDALEILEHLVDQSLLKTTDTAFGTRFRMLETVREFSALQRDAAGETGKVTENFLAWAREFGRANYETVFGPDPFGAAGLLRAEQDNLAYALRLGLSYVDGETVAPVAAALGGLWMVEANYPRAATVLPDVAWMLSHYHPQPHMVEVTRAAAALYTVFSFLFEGPKATRTMVTLRRFSRTRPDTAIRALATVLADLPELLAGDRAGLWALCESDDPVLAGIANGLASYVRQFDDDHQGALASAKRLLDALGNAASPWAGLMAHARVGELAMLEGDGETALRHMHAAIRLQEQLGDTMDVIGLRPGMVMASLQLGDVEQAERWLDQSSIPSLEHDPTMFTFAIGLRAEIQLHRGNVDAGLELWRRAIEVMRGAKTPYLGLEPELDPWLLEGESVAVTAHVRHGRLDLIPHILGTLPGKLVATLDRLRSGPLPSLTDFPVCGTILLSLATVVLARARRTGDEASAVAGAEMTALAERFQFIRNFPTMKLDVSRREAENAAGSAYHDAVSRYADLDREELRVVALDLVATNFGG